MKRSEYFRMYDLEAVHWWYAGLHDLVLRFIPRDRPGQRIYDAGCGTGRLLQLLQERGNAEGCDVSDIAVRLCRERGLSAAVSGDLNVLVLPRGAYDIIVSTDVLYHRGIADDRALLRKFHDALRPGGSLILQVPAYEWLRSDHDRAVHTARRYSRSQVREMLIASGFPAVRTTYRVCALFPFIAAVRMAQKALRFLGWRMDRPSSDVRTHSPAANALLTSVLKAENALLERVSLPFGSSIFAVARKAG